MLLWWDQGEEGKNKTLILLLFSIELIQEFTFFFHEKQRDQQHGIPKSSFKLYININLTKKKGAGGEGAAGFEEASDNFV